MSTTPAAETPSLQPEKEVRLAVVMYGGVSLCIYINGIAQELLRLVRATAEDPSQKGKVRPALGEHSTEHVYREVARILGREQPHRGEASGGEDRLRVRFVVDVLSGTSAGGLNAIFLAKALANGQSLEALKTLWIEEGDIAKLLNDSGSRKGGVREQEPPQSLLNSQRMYRELLRAFDGMDEAKRHGEKRVPLVDEVDLFITTTDIRGLLVPLQLADQVVYERRHRNVFHLRYCENPEAARNDFAKGNNPFLAFAGRCTSAFPGAFEPMRFEDVNPVLAADRDSRRVKVEQWQDFFPAYQAPNVEGATAVAPDLYDLRNHSFGDGGYLDNKPFSYAIDMLARRRSHLPVDRKLVYIEPAPEHVEEALQKGERPNAIENVVAALSLARYETIREDLERVLSRNRLLGRVERILSQVEEDVALHDAGVPLPDADYAQRDVRFMVEWLGVGYGGYHRLKVASVTDDIATMLACAMGYEPESDRLVAIRHLVRAWREMHYLANRTGDATRDAQEAPAPGETLKRTQNAFLLRYDLAYRVRRLSFVLERIDRLALLDADAQRSLRHQGIPQPPTDEAQGKRFREQLWTLRDGLRAELGRLLQLRQTLERRGEGNPLRESLLEMDITEQDFVTLLQEQDEGECQKLARALIHGQRVSAFHALEARLTGLIADVTLPVSDACKALLCPFQQGEAPPSTGDGREVALYAVRACYYRFDQYDMVAFPILYSTEVGEESDGIDVVRISPEDATALVDERKTHQHKLAGVALGHFGAFLDPRWRVNDIIWGRLDGTERLITMLLPGKKYEQARAMLILDAQSRVLAEEFGGSRTAIRHMLEARSSPPEAAPEPRGRALDEKVATRINALLGENRPELDTRESMHTVARTTQVVGRMMGGMAERYRLLGSPAQWLVRAGRLLWGLVEVATPQSIPALIAEHWLSLFYLFVGLAFAGGTLLGRPELQSFSLFTLAVTAGSHLVITLTRNFLLRPGQVLQGWKRVGVPALVGLGGVLVGLPWGVGVIQLLERWDLETRVVKGLRLAGAVLVALVALWLLSVGLRAVHQWRMRASDRRKLQESRGLDAPLATAVYPAELVGQPTPEGRMDQAKASDSLGKTG